MMGGIGGAELPASTTQLPAPRARGRAMARGVVLVCAMGLVSQAAAGQQHALGDRSLPLEGRWRIELLLDSASHRHSPTAEQATGELAFSSIAWLRGADRFGRHSVDLRPFFGRSFAAPMNAAPFSAADTSFLTEISGGLSKDSVAIDFIPRLGHYGISLRGRFFGDSARGRWYRRGSDGAGRFVIRRVSKEAVAVAAIPEPPAAVTSVASSAPTSAVAPRRGKKSAAKAAVPTAPGAAATTTVASTATTTAPTAPPLVVATAASASAAARTTAPSPEAPAARTTGPITQAPAAAGARVPVARRAVVVSAGPPPVPRGSAAGASDMGAIRVRMFDRASNRWFVTQFQLRNPEGRWTWGNMRSGSGPDGWGPEVRRPPGRYDIMVPNFVCGDKFWFFAKEVRRKVEVRAGETADVSIELDLSAEPAKKTMENKTGARCTAGPGTLP